MTGGRAVPANGSRGTFWRWRFERSGHTGWSDPVIYAFDQLERLELVRRIVSETPPPSAAAAIDFGCGTGDFSRLLLEAGCRVWGYDPFVEPRIDSPRFTYVPSLAASGLPADAAIATSITALDHVLEDHEFDAALEWLRARLAPSGRLVALEYAIGDADEARHATAYQAFRSMSHWQRALERRGFRVESVEPMPQPLLSPSAGYLAYRRSMSVRLFGSRLLRRLPSSRRRLSEAARRTLGRFPPPARHEIASPLKLLIARPAE